MNGLHTGAVELPVIGSITVTRTDPIRADIRFSVTPSERNVDFFLVDYYTMTGPNNSQLDTQVSAIHHYTESMAKKM